MQFCWGSCGAAVQLPQPDFGNFIVVANFFPPAVAICEHRDYRVAVDIDSTRARGTGSVSRVSILETAVSQSVLFPY
jgi:hypothetical protein